MESIPGGRRSVQGLGDRSAMAATDGETVYVGNGDDYSIQAYGSDGTLKKIIRRRVDPNPANQAQVDSALARMREAGDEVPESRRAAFERRLLGREAALEERLSHYETMPAFFTVAVDQGKRLWVRISAHRFRYDVFSPEGVWIRSVTLPSEPLFLGASDALFSRTDDLGVPLVEVYPLPPR